MKIFYITSSSTASGGSRQAVYTAQGLSQRGHELTFFAPLNAQLPALAPELRWEALPPSRRQWGACIARLLPRDETFIVHAFHNKAVKHAAWWGLFWKARGAVMAAQRGVVYKPNNPLPYWSPGIDCFMANSQACARVLRAKGVGLSRLHVVYNGIPKERITPLRSAKDVRRELDIPSDAFVLGCVANDSANKGADLLLRALARTGLPQVRLLLAGVTPQTFAPLVSELGLNDRVHLPGPVTHVADYLQLCQAFVLPSLSESMPNTLQEAVCMGLPVAASDVGGVPECVQGNGLLVQPGDVNTLQKALRRLFLDDTSRQTWSRASRSLAATFSMQRKLDQVEEIYMQYVRSRTATPVREPAA